MSCSHVDDESAHNKTTCKRLKGLNGKELYKHEPRGGTHTLLNASKEVSVLLLLVWTVLYEIHLPLNSTLFILATVAGGWVVWRGCKSAYIAWNHLDYLHRVIIQEKQALETNREQSRKEITEMYRAKGLEGKLLNDVIDLFMSDDDRFLKIMIEEEFRITLESYDHPLKVGSGACLGAFTASFLILFASTLYPHFGVPVLAFILLGVSEGVLAYLNGRKIIASSIWTMAIGAMSVGLSHFLILWVQSFWHSS